MTARFNGKGFQNAGDQIWRRLEDAMSGAVNVGEGTAKKAAPVDTGHLRGSISNKTERKDKQIIGTIYTNVEYAAHQEFGTKNGVVGQFFMRKGIESAGRYFIKIAKEIEGDIK